MTKKQVEFAFKYGASVAFRVKGEEEWIYTNDPLWNWGVCDYKIIDLEVDDYYW